VRNCPPTTSGDPEQNGNGLSSVSTQAGLDFLIEQLQGMFPNVSTSTIALFTVTPSHPHDNAFEKR